MTTDNDYLTPATRRVAEDKAVSDQVMAEWQAARAFTPQKYAQQVLYPAIEVEVRDQFKGRLTNEVDGEIKARQNQENVALTQLSPAEIEVCYRFGQRPTQYVANKRPK